MIERYVWQRNAEGGQLIGNLMEIRPYDHETFLRCDVRDKPQMAPDLRAMWASIVSKDNGQTWCLMWVRETVGALRPGALAFARGWAIHADDFSSPEAQAHIHRADSESEDRQLALALL